MVCDLSHQSGLDVKIFLLRDVIPISLQATPGRLE